MVRWLIKLFLYSQIFWLTLISSYASVNNLGVRESCICQFSHNTGQGLKIAENDDLVLRQAKLSDVDELKKMFANITEEDKKRLVIFPESYRPWWIKKVIKHKTLYIAIKDSTIVAFVRVLPVLDQRLLYKIVFDELKCVGKQRRLVQSGYYILPTSRVNSFEPIKYVENNASFDFNSLNQTFVYYGSSYTVDAYRKQGIGSKLKKFAFISVLNDVLDDIKAKKSKELVFLYGQVPINMSHTAMVRAFMLLAFNVLSKISSNILYQTKPILTFNQYIYRSYKPIFTMVNGHCVCEPLEYHKWNDFGCVVSCKLGDYTNFT